MPTIGVQHCLRDFEVNLDRGLELLAECKTYKIVNRIGRPISIGSRRKELFASIALLRMHLAWEDFIESTFLRYLCGAHTVKGFAPILIEKPYTTIDSAFTKLLDGQSYITWSLSKIDKLAGIYFQSGEPYVAAISASRNKLTEIINIRNRFAHRSDHATIHFEKIVRGVIGYMPRGINPGRFLLMSDPSAPDLRFISSVKSFL